MNEETKRGGQRKGAGRKPLDNPKKPITVYLEKNKIMVMGGDEKLKLKLVKFVDNETKMPEVIAIQDLTRPTSEIKPITDVKPQSYVVMTVLPQMPVKPPKTLAQYIQAKRECELPEQYEELLAGVEADPYLSQKQKTMFKLA